MYICYTLSVIFLCVLLWDVRLGRKVEWIVLDTDCIAESYQIREILGHAVQEHVDARSFVSRARMRNSAQNQGHESIGGGFWDLCGNWIAVGKHDIWNFFLLCVLYGCVFKMCWDFERFRAGVTPIRPFLLMYRLDMLSQDPFLPKWFDADIAWVSSRTLVDQPDMPTQRRGKWEGFWANATYPRAYLDVYALHMFSQPDCLFECLRAYATLVKPIALMNRWCRRPRGSG